jgi:hypothetical protein
MTFLYCNVVKGEKVFQYCEGENFLNILKKCEKGKGLPTVLQTYGRPFPIVIIHLSSFWITSTVVYFIDER